MNRSSNGAMRKNGRLKSTSAVKTQPIRPMNGLLPVRATSQTVPDSNAQTLDVGCSRGSLNGHWKSMEKLGSYRRGNGPNNCHGVGVPRILLLQGKAPGKGHRLISLGFASKAPFLTVGTADLHSRKRQHDDEKG